MKLVQPRLSNCDTLYTFYIDYMAFIKTYTSYVHLQACGMKSRTFKTSNKLIAYMNVKYMPKVKSCTVITKVK